MVLPSEASPVQGSRAGSSANVERPSRAEQVRPRKRQQVPCFRAARPSNFERPGRAEQVPAAFFERPSEAERARANFCFFWCEPCLVCSTCVTCPIGSAAAPECRRVGQGDSKNLCITPLHSIPFHSTPFHPTPFHSTPLLPTRVREKMIARARNQKESF